MHLIFFVLFLCVVVVITTLWYYMLLLMIPNCYGWHIIIQLERVDLDAEALDPYTSLKRVYLKIIMRIQKKGTHKKIHLFYSEHHREWDKAIYLAGFQWSRSFSCENWKLTYIHLIKMKKKKLLLSVCSNAL